MRLGNGRRSRSKGRLLSMFIDFRSKKPSKWPFLIHFRGRKPLNWPCFCVCGVARSTWRIETVGEFASHKSFASAPRVFICPGRMLSDVHIFPKTALEARYRRSKATKIVTKSHRIASSTLIFDAKIGLVMKPETFLPRFHLRLDKQPAASL